MTMVFCIALTFQPVRVNSVASQSSSSGCDGASPWDPKSSDVLTIPTPKYCCQNRFTVTRDNSGFAGSTSQFARPRRLDGYVVLVVIRADGIFGVTTSPGLSYCPRISKCVSRGGDISCITITV